MATKVDWASIGGSGDKESRRSKLQFMKFESGKGRTFRPIGGAVKFVKFFVNNRSVCVDEAYGEEAAARLESHSGQKFSPRTRYAINVIDREDGQIRILEGGPQIFKHFGNWSKLNQGAPPGGKAGMDWSVMADGDGLNREYSTMPVRPAPLSQEEITMANEVKEKYSLSEVFAGIPMDELIEKAFGERKKTAAPAAAAAAPVEATAAAAATLDDEGSW